MSAPSVWCSYQLCHFIITTRRWWRHPRGEGNVTYLISDTQKAFMKGRFIGENTLCYALS